MEDYIFLILAIVITIFAAVKKNKKKEDVAHQKKQPEPPRHFLFDQLIPEEVKAEVRDEFDFPDWPDMEAENEPVTGQPVPVMVQEQPKPYDIPHQEFETHLPEQKKSNIKLSVTKKVQEEESYEEEETSGYLEDFSLRKAIIYSEMLKPKFEDTQTTLF